jgi:hypothetical protein
VSSCSVLSSIEQALLRHLTKEAVVLPRRAG